MTEAEKAENDQFERDSQIGDDLALAVVDLLDEEAADTGADKHTMAFPVWIMLTSYLATHGWTRDQLSVLAQDFAEPCGYTLNPESFKS